MASSGSNELRSVITFHSPIRTFNRIFAENSLWEMKDAVRKKLGVSLALPIHLDHLQGEYCIALEDDDDFSAFQLLAKSIASLVVRVTVGDTTDETPNDESITVATQLPPVNTSSDNASSVHSRKRRASISKTVATSKKIRPVEHTAPTLEERSKRKRSAVDEENPNLKANPDSNVLLEPSPAADVPASPKRKKLKRNAIPAGPSDSANGTDALALLKESSSVLAPKKKKEKVGDSTSKGPTVVDTSQNLSGQLDQESYIATSSDLYPSTKSAKPKKKGREKSINDTMPDRMEEIEKDGPPAASDDVQVSKKKTTNKKKAMEAESLHSVSPLADLGNPRTSKSSAGKSSRVSNVVKKNIGLAPEVPISKSLSAAGKKEKKKKAQKTLLSNEGEPEETVADAYDNFFRSGQELDHDHEVSNQVAFSSKNAKKRPTEITKADGDSTNSAYTGFFFCQRAGVYN
ncbi:hypothetical protein DFS33DRAFT_67920 [Desarmillaria ectypa]|nr:hypothetical protein DFS33DRAFT_67920 [Desarmillaria ectypa]